MGRLLHRVTSFGFAGMLALAAFTAFAGSASTASAAAPTLDHFHCYRATETTAVHFSPPASVQLKDAFGTETVDVGPVKQLCNPTNKQLIGGQQFPPLNPDAHLVCFGIQDPNFRSRTITEKNQFGTAKLDVIRPVMLCLPSWKNLDAPQFPAATAPPGLDHFKCYIAHYTLDDSGVPVDPFENKPAQVISTDEFGRKQPTLLDPTLYCLPVEKTRTDLPGGPQTTPITDPNDHLVCFPANDDQRYTFKPFAKNQFGIAQLQGTAPGAAGPLLAGDLLCVPSTSTK